MNDNEAILQSPLMKDVCADDLDKMLCCLDAQRRTFAKDEIIFLAGYPAERVGIVMEGCVQVLREDMFGNRTILARLGAGDLFGEAFACAGVDTLPVSVQAVFNCTVLMLDYRRIATTCTSACAFHNRLIQNMLSILAGKNIALNGKNEVLSARSLRDKLLTYLHRQATEAGSRHFRIPFNRQELADYLSVDRSSLSRELSRLRDEKVLRFNRYDFTLLA